MKRVFLDEELQRQFERDGYAVVDVLTDDDLARLDAVYLALSASADVPSYGFHISLDYADRPRAREATAAIYAIVEPRLGTVFVDHRAFAASFVVKESNPHSLVYPHQDWTFVDETEFWSATLWTPLVDVTIENGALGVIPGSHLAFDWLRGSPSPQYATPIAEHALETLYPMLESLPIRRGRSVLWDNRTIHGSAPNTSGVVRPAVGVGITHRDARLYHHYLVPNAATPCLETYAVDREFFADHGNTRLYTIHESGGAPEGVAAEGRRELALERMSADAVRGRVLAARAQARADSAGGPASSNDEGGPTR
jgi:hypothetical protein